MIPTNKKLAVLHPYLDKKGGAANMMIYLSNILSYNNNVNFYTFSYDDKVFPSKENAFQIKCFKNSKLVSFLKIAYSIRNCEYVLIGNSPMHFVGVLSKLLFGSNAKLIWWHHHYPWYYSGKTTVYIKLKRFIEKCFVKNIDTLIVNSKYLQDSIKDIYKVDSKKLYPVLDNKFLNQNKENKNVLSASKIIFTYGRWVEGKNLSLVLKTFEDLKNKIPDLVLKIGGEGNEYEYYKNKFKTDKNINFLGYVDKTKIIKNLEQSNLFLFPSKVDSFGIVLLEAMSIGNPVISYNLSGAKEIVKNGINGYLVNSDSEFIKRSYEILTNSSLRNNLSIEAIKTSLTFSERNFNKQLTKIF